MTVFSTDGANAEPAASRVKSLGEMNGISVGLAKNVFMQAQRSDQHDDLVPLMIHNEVQDDCPAWIRYQGGMDYST